MDAKAYDAHSQPSTSAVDMIIYELEFGDWHEMHLQWLMTFTFLLVYLHSVS